MDSLSIDIETFSSVDLKKCGVYKYVESPDFEILLFGYSIDGNSVKVIDLACGETIPKAVLDALTDNSVTKWAFNAQFERVCLSKYIGVKMNADSWKCSMIWAATLGLPLSLEGVGAVLGLEKQKLTEGKELIRYFCTPARLKDGSFARHLPSDNPERWEAFKKYNRRDVEVETGIKEKLAKFPVSESEWINYRLDQKINDRGIMLDMPFVRSAIKCDDNIKSENIEEVRRLTGVSNPNSVTQMKEWLTGQGLDVDSLSKATVTALLETASDDVERVLMLRRQLSKSSVKKYTAMENAVCRDSRARGLIQFYGANRTGRYCLSGDHEVLTDTGWKRLDEWTGGNIACWNPLSEMVSFQNAKQLVFPYKGEMYEYEDKRISQLSTPDHKMYVKKSYGGRWTVDTVENMAHYRPSIPFTGYRSGRPGLEQEKLRVIVMIQADGHYTNDGTIKLCFTKSRKAERCKALLRSAGIIYVYNEYPQNGKTRFTFSVPSRNVPLWLRLFKDKTFDTWLFDESPDVFFDELQYWDGYRSAKNSIQYSTCNRQNADIVQAFAHITGRAASMRIKNRSAEHPNWKDAYVVDIWLTPINCHEVRNKPTVSNFDGNVYCAETKTGFFLVRRNQKVWVTGNSGRLIQVQNLPKNNIPDIAEARELVKSENYEACEMLYECIPLVLSELIRTAFIPKNGCRFYVADFSAIEARVIAWLAGEEWRIETFKEGKDIYCASASQMFGVPVEKHGVNGHLRQKGKIAELACIAEGQLVLTDKGEVPIEQVTTDMKLWDGIEWVSHDGVIYKGEREVITYEGLTATPDHLVWCEGKQRPIYLGDATACGAHLLQTGNGRSEIRMGENNITRKKMEQQMESLLCVNRMHRLWFNPMAVIKQLTKGCLKGLSGLFSITTDTEMAVQTADSSKAKMFKSKKSSISKLWRSRNSIRFFIHNRGRLILNKKIWITKQKFRNRPHRQQWKLCSGKYQVCNTYRKQSKQETNRAYRFPTKILAVFKTRSNTKISKRTNEIGYYSRCGKCGSYEEKGMAANPSKVRVYDIRNAGKHHRFTVSNCLVHNCGYGGSVGAMKAMGADEMGLSDEDIKKIVTDWRQSNPKIVKLWYDIDKAVITTVEERSKAETHGIFFYYQSGFLFIRLPSGRRLAYIKPRIGENRFGGKSVTYEGISGVKKWERLESYGAKFVENIVQAIARDILAEAMLRLDAAGFDIVMHVHDEAVIEAPKNTSLENICAIMGQTPSWAKGLLLRADGYECEFYRKD